MNHDVDYLDVAGDALRWVGGQQLPLDDLYSGTASVLLACAEATAFGVGCDEPADHALGRLSHLVGTGSVVTGEEGLFGARPGWLVALQAWRAVSDDPRAEQAADQLSREIAREVLEADPSRRPYDVISGDAGTLIALLPEDSDVVRDAVVLIVDRLVDAAQRAAYGLQWVMAPGEGRLMPGFSHGTAGIAHALLLAGRSLDRPDLVDLAAEAGRSLIALAGAPWAIPNLLPPKTLPPPVSFGWCHGPAGTVRLFTLLDLVLPDPQWQQAISYCLQALRDSGLPERRHPGFWDNVGRCCGTAGVGMTVLDRYQATGDTELLGWSARLADDVLSYAITDATGTRWSNVENRADPQDLPPEPGLMQGAAGVASWLARLGRLQVDADAGLPWSVGGSSYC